jgi:uncharacterized protein YggE
MELKTFKECTTMRNKIYITLIAFILIGFLAACTGAEAAPLSSNTTGQGVSTANLRTLNVNGTGRIYLVPDLAYINIGVHTEGANVAESLSSNTSQAQKVAEVLKSLGIDPKDIQTTNFNVYPQQKYGPNGEQTGVSYVVDNTVYVTVRDLTKLGQILDAVVSSGANNINGIQFDSTAKDQALVDARKAAINDARQQAQALAEAAGVTLDAIQSINVSNNTPVPMYDAKGGAAMASSGSPVPVSAGQLVIEVDANLLYSIK